LVETRAGMAKVVKQNQGCVMGTNTTIDGLSLSKLERWANDGPVSNNDYQMEKLIDVGEELVEGRESVPGEQQLQSSRTIRVTRMVVRGCELTPVLEVLKV